MSYALTYQQPDGSSPHRRVGIFGVALPLPPPLTLGPSPLFPGKAAQCGHVNSGFGAQEVLPFFFFLVGGGNHPLFAPLVLPAHLYH